MGCSSCGTGGCGTNGGGCGKKGGCSSGGCNKMNTFDWLSNMEFAGTPKFNITEVRFKGGRKEFYRNSNNLELNIGDPVIVDVPNGHHLGYISLTGELVRLQMKKKSIALDENIKSIYRIAGQKDLEKHENARKRENPTLFRARQIITDLKLDMKLSDVEYQADNTKATFFYSAEERVDFRELIKLLAAEFKIRVEMRQISLRQEAGRLGGIGSCGRELCCATWLSDFKSVSTSAARYQNLSLNPTKLSGQCGRLKCCLNYELETYMDALQDIPNIEEPLLTQKGPATLQKTDIFKKIMWFGFHEETTWYPLNVKRVNEILELNKKGVKPATLDTNELVEKDDKEALKEKSELARFDDKFKKKKKKKKNKNRNNNNPNNSNNQSNQGQNNNQNRNNQNQNRNNQNNPKNPNKPNNQGNNQGNPQHKK
ncbi:MAG: Signal peptidase-like protein [Cytophagaceae bacterium]|nr:Signal peptidase-like protein [Cytophagaceae bacterium]